jgi:rod shape-determining protein MreC
VEALIARYRNVTVLAVVIFAQLLLLGYQIRNNRDMRLIRVWGVTAIAPVAHALHGTHQAVSGFWNRYIALYSAQDENQRLREELDRLKLENQAMRAALHAAGRLDNLAEYQQILASKTLVASIMGAGANPNARIVFLNKGSGAGVKPGMAVITPDGIVGKVQAVFPGASFVQLISDPYSAVGVILEQSRVHGIMKGMGLHEMRLDYVPHEEKVSLGERVYTSGQDRVFPKGLLAGVVTAVKAGRDFQEITVQPAARLTRLEEVLVVTEGIHENVPSEIPPAQTPEVLLPPPESGPADVTDLAPAEAPASAGGPQGYTPLTDADRLRKRYRELGQAQGHVFGEGLPGSKPPDFNAGWTPQGPRPPAPKPRPASPPPETP